MKDAFDTGWKMEALLGSDSLIPKEWAYAEGFRTAARVLAEQAGHYGIDTLVYPIVFNYRQYFELTFKRMHAASDVYDAIVNNAAVARTSVPETHDLPRLWNGVRPRLVARCGNGAEYTPVDKLVQELNRLDPSSEASRYATTRKGGKLHTLDRLNVGDFMNMADEAALLLVGSEAMLEENAWLHQDMMAEFRP